MAHYSIHMTIFESFQVKHRNKIILETLDFGEAMKAAREAARDGKRGIVLQLAGSRDHYVTRGYWQDGVWFE